MLLLSKMTELCEKFNLTFYKSARSADTICLISTEGTLFAKQDIKNGELFFDLTIKSTTDIPQNTLLKLVKILETYAQTYDFSTLNFSIVSPNKSIGLLGLEWNVDDMINLFTNKSFGYKIKTEKLRDNTTSVLASKTIDKNEITLFSHLIAFMNAASELQQENNELYITYRDLRHKEMSLLIKTPYCSKIIHCGENYFYLDKAQKVYTEKLVDVKENLKNCLDSLYLSHRLDNLFEEPKTFYNQLVNRLTIPPPVADDAYTFLLKHYDWIDLERYCLEILKENSFFMLEPAPMGNSVRKFPFLEHELYFWIEQKGFKFTFHLNVFHHEEKEEIKNFCLKSLRKEE